MDTNELLDLRQAQVEQALETFRQGVAAMEQELADIATARRVFSTLDGAGRDYLREAAQPKPKGALAVKASGAPTIPEMIYQVLFEAYRQGKVGLEPKEIADAIDAKEGWGPINRDVLRTRAWRLARDHKLVKAKDAAIYALPNPENYKPAGADPEGEEPAGLFPQAQGGEARPGGGT